MKWSMIANDETTGHEEHVLELLEDATEFDCLVAFATGPGFKSIEELLEERLNAGDFTARFFVGLHFYHTDPDLLYKLLRLSQRYPQRFRFYIGSPDHDTIYHPKIYAFYTAKRAHFIVGSANLTSGGMNDNHEISARFEGALAERDNSRCREQLDAFIASLLESGEMVVAEKPLIDEYRVQHAIFKTHLQLARRRAKRSAAQARNGGAVHADALETLREICQEMRADLGEEGFDHQARLRVANRKTAARQLARLRDASDPGGNFEELYDPLCNGLWHSGGLSRGKSVIGRQATQFQKALKNLDTYYLKNADVAVETVFAFAMEQLGPIARAGTNVVTEILHTYDNLRFAVMNQNSVAGMRLAGILEFPEKPGKGNLTPDVYANFCRKADEVRELLGLENFSELDALFNYAYWDEE